MVHLVTLAGASAAVLASAATAFTMTITNGCSTNIDLYTRLASIYTDESETIAPGASLDKTIGKGYEGHFRNGSDDAATLIEIATKGDLDIAWFDIGIIPPRLKPGFEFCTTLEECKQNSESGIGYNTPVQITPTSNLNGQNCRELTCLADGCDDAYNYPQDDTKTHSCPFGTDFIVTFCPSNDSQQPTSGSSEMTTPMPTEPATDFPVQETPAISDNSANNAYNQDDAMDGEPDTAVPEVIQNDVVDAESEATVPEVIEAETPALEATQAEIPTSEVIQVETPEVTTAATKYCA